MIMMMLIGLQGGRSHCILERLKNIVLINRVQLCLLRVYNASQFYLA